MNNREVAQILYELADFYEMENAPFKPRAYQKAAAAIENLDEPIEELYKQQDIKGFFAIPGVGQGIAEHLEELLKTGEMKKYKEFKKKFPVDLPQLRSLKGLGPRTIKTLYEKLGVRNLKDLRKVLRSHKVAKLPGFGPTSEKKIQASLGFHETHSGRFVLGHIFPAVQDLAAKLKQSGQFERLEIGGSFRRRQETVGDIDVLATAYNPKKAMAFFVNLPGLSRVLEHGPTKSEISLKNGLQVDLRIVPSKSWGAALQYFTGDKAHNVKLRKIAISKGLKLSEYGLFKGLRMVAGRSEEEVYKKLVGAWIPPELRTDTGEIEAAQKGILPRLLDYGDVRGDLQVQTDWTDGADSIEAMARFARDLGREYICITDHTKSLYVTHGLDEKRLVQQMKEIDRINAKLKAQSAKFRVLKGAEVNILKDGSLDIADEVLAKLDVVGISIHSFFQMNREDMTARIVRAISNPHADVLFHPTTRVIQRRGPIDFDFAAALKAAKKNKVALEIDAYPDRLDLHDTLIRQTVAAGVKLVIDSDAHSTKHLGYLYLGEAQARRGWATKHDVLNTQSVDKLLRYFGSSHGENF